MEAEAEAHRRSGATIQPPTTRLFPWLAGRRLLGLGCIRTRSIDCVQSPPPHRIYKSLATTLATCRSVCLAYSRCGWLVRWRCRPRSAQCSSRATPCSCRVWSRARPGVTARRETPTAGACACGQSGVRVYGMRACVCMERAGGMLPPSIGASDTSVRQDVHISGIGTVS